MSDWREWLLKLQEKASHDQMTDHKMQELVRGLTLCAEAVEAVGEFWDASLSDGMEAIKSGEISDTESLDRWFMERVVKLGRDEEASQKIIAALEWLRGVGRG